MQADITAGLSAAAVLAINVAMDPGNQQVQACTHGTVRAGVDIRTGDGPAL